MAKKKKKVKKSKKRTMQDRINDLVEMQHNGKLEEELESGAAIMNLLLEGVEADPEVPSYIKMMMVFIVDLFIVACLNECERKDNNNSPPARPDMKPSDN